MKAFVTGGTGFIGRHVVRKLLDRGYEVAALARSPESAVRLSEMGADVVSVTSQIWLRCVKAWRAAIWCSIWPGCTRSVGVDREEMEIVNVGGTRKVLRLAYELGVPKIVYTSTVNVFGDTKGVLVDETYRARTGLSGQSMIAQNGWPIIKLLCH